MPILTFGQYKDHDITDPKIPTSYVEWLTINTKDPTRTMAAEELQRRSEGRVGAGSTAKYSKGEFAEKLLQVIMKMPEGLNEQTVQANGYEIKIRKLF